MGRLSPPQHGDDDLTRVMARGLPVLNDIGRLLSDQSQELLIKQDERIKQSLSEGSDVASVPTPRGLKEFVVRKFVIKKF